MTIWFQNKRQTERKTAATNSGQGNTFNELNVQPNITSTIHTFSLHNDNHSTSRTASPPFSVSSRSSASAPSTQQPHAHHGVHTSSSARPSLDRVASRSELRAAAPRTPSRRHNPSSNTSQGSQIYDNMPSSPLAPPISPPARDFIDFGKNGKTRRTLEWACAAARLVDKDGYATGLSTGFGTHHNSQGGTAGLTSTYGSASASAEAYLHSHSHLSKNRGRSVIRERTQSLGRVHGSGSVHKDRERSSRRSDGSVRRVSGSGSVSLRAENSFSSTSSSRSHGHRMDVDQTDSEEDHEAITPPSTWGKGDARWSSSSGESRNIMSLTAAAAAASEEAAALPKGVDDDAMFKAALALCGLGRR